MMDGKIKECSFFTTCVACGQRYLPKYFHSDKCVMGSSDHVCDPARLKRREEQLRHDWDEESPYCECDDLDCKFEYIETMMNEMQ